MAWPWLWLVTLLVDTQLCLRDYALHHDGIMYKHDSAPCCGHAGVPPELQPLNAVLEATVNASQVNEMTSAAQDAVER